jgi:hypothetical protein
MLSDAERHRLAEIESSLQTDDPRFVHRFDTRLGRGRRLLNAARIGLVASLIAVVAAPASGSVPTAIVGLITAGVSAGVWITHRRC